MYKKRRRLEIEVGQKIYTELLRFKEGLYKQNKEEVIRKVYEIDCYICIYELMMEQIATFSTEELYQIQGTGNVLEYLYFEWLSVPDSVTEELRNSIVSSVHQLSRKEGA